METGSINMKIQLNRMGAAVLLSAGILGGCAVTPSAPPLYQWNGYQAQLYEYFKADSKSVDEQIIALEQSAEKIKASGLAFPPGFHAHLAMLYAHVGKEDQALQHFQAEKELFPESAEYIDFLLKKDKK